MKKVFSLMALAAMAFAFTACSSSDDDGVSKEMQEKLAAAAAVAKNYSGYTTVKFAYSATPYTYEGEALTITNNNDGTVNAAFENNLWGTFALENASVVTSGSKYIISGNDSVAMSMGGHGSSSKKYYFEETITVENGVAVSNISVPGVMGGVSIVFTSGAAPDIWSYRGLYTGATTAKFAYGELPYSGDSCTVTVNVDGTYNVEYVNSNYTSTMGMIGFGTFEASSVEATTNSDGNYEFSSTGTTSLTMSNNPTDYEYTMTGVINAKSKSVSITVSLPTLMQGSTLTYESSKFTKGQPTK